MSASDLALAYLAEAEAELREQLERTTIERDGYRELARAGIQELHDLRREVESLRRQLAHQRDEIRRLRGAEASAAA